MAFPTSPTDNQVYTLGSNQFRYDSATSKWDIISTGVSTAPSIAARATDPTTRDDGTALVEGDFYYNTADDAIKTYDGSAWNASGGGSTDYGAVGTYGFFLTQSSSTFEPGTTASGASLFVGSRTDGLVIGTVERYNTSEVASAGRSGTWRRMARQSGNDYATNSNDNAGPTLWVRIS